MTYELLPLSCRTHVYQKHVRATSITSEYKSTYINLNLNLNLHVRTTSIRSKSKSTYYSPFLVINSDKLPCISKVSKVAER